MTTTAPNVPEGFREVQRLVKSHSRVSLVNTCKEHGLSCTGTKHDLATRIVRHTQPTLTFASVGSASVSERYVTDPSSTSLSIVLKHLPASAQVDVDVSHPIDLLSDAYEPATGLVFDRKTHFVKARLCSEGNVAKIHRLRWVDLETCRDMKLPFLVSEEMDPRPDDGSKEYLEHRRKYMTFLKGEQQLHANEDDDDDVPSAQED